MDKWVKVAGVATSTVLLRDRAVWTTPTVTQLTQSPSFF